MRSMSKTTRIVRANPMSTSYVTLAQGLVGGRGQITRDIATGGESVI